MKQVEVVLQLSHPTSENRFTYQLFCISQSLVGTQSQPRNQEWKQRRATRKRQNERTHVKLYVTIKTTRNEPAFKKLKERENASYLGSFKEKLLRVFSRRHGPIVLRNGPFILVPRARNFFSFQSVTRITVFGLL